MKAPTLVQMTEAAAALAFLGVIGFIMLTLADTFICTLAVALPYLALCFLVNEVVKLWPQR